MSTPKNIYVGNRYVPKLFNDGNGGAEWRNNVGFESLMVVTNQGNSYTSRQIVPIGIDINNKSYWVKTSDYNAQIAIYEQNVRDYNQYVIDQILNINNDFTDYKTETKNELDSQIAELTVNVKQYGALGDGVHDDTSAIKSAIDFIKSSGGTLFFPKGTYLCRNIVVPSNITFLGDNASIKAKNVFYTQTTNSVSINGNTVTIQDASDVNIGDIVSVKSDNVDLLVVTGKNGNAITIEPFRIFKENGESHVGFKYPHGVGSDFIVFSQLFWITQGLTTSFDVLDTTPKVGGIENVTFNGIKFVGSKNSNDYNKYSDFDLVTNGALFMYRTLKVNIEKCSFENFYNTPNSFYGWNSDFKFINNMCIGIGGMLPLTVSAQQRDSSTGVSLHWDMRFSNDLNSAKPHINDKYIISNNIFNNCWNGGIFVSATKNGVINNNLVENFKSHGISVYGGDLGIGTENVNVFSNTVVKGRKETDPLAYGIGIWCSVITRNCNVNNNIIDNCEIGLQLETTTGVQVNNNNISNCVDRYLILKYNNGNIIISNNILSQTYEFSDSTANSRIVELNSTGSAYENASIVFKGNFYSLPSTFKGSAIIALVKSNATTFINEKPIALIGYLDISDVVSSVKAKCISCDFTSVPSSGLTSGNSTRFNCIETNGSNVSSTGSAKITYNFKDVAVVDGGTTSVRPTTTTIGLMFFDTTLGKPIWWNGSVWKDSTGATV